MGVIVNGKYYKDESKAPVSVQPTISKQVESHNLEMASNKHDRELIQPWLKNGEPNPDFIKYYPAEAKEYGMIGG